MAPEDGPLLQKLLHYEQCRPDWVFCSFLDHQAKIIDAMTVAAFLTNVRSAAAWLMRQGLRRGDRVVLSLPTSRAFVVGYFAVQWLGAIPVPLPEPSLLFKRRAYCDRMVGVIADCSPAACIVLPAALEKSIPKMPRRAGALCVTCCCLGRTMARSRLPAPSRRRPRLRPTIWRFCNIHPAAPDRRRALP